MSPQIPNEQLAAIFDNLPVRLIAKSSLASQPVHDVADHVVSRSETLREERDYNALRNKWETGRLVEVDTHDVFRYESLIWAWEWTGADNGVVKFIVKTHTTEGHVMVRLCRLLENGRFVSLREILIKFPEVTTTVTDNFLIIRHRSQLSTNSYREFIRFYLKESLFPLSHINEPLKSLHI